MSDGAVIETFVSRPTWAPAEIEAKLAGFYQLLEEKGFKANTIGKSQVALRTPFEDVQRLIKRCRCTIVLGLPQVFIQTGSIKDVELEHDVALPTEWNQIEATMSLMLDLPTLVLLHGSVSSRGIFDRGAANVFVHAFDSSDPAWLDGIASVLAALRSELEG
jgi:hypothetical protein